MPQLRRSPFWSVFLAYSLIVLVLFGNTGVGLTGILCGCTGKQYIALFAANADCCGHGAEKKQPTVAEKSCCSHDKTDVCAVPQVAKIDKKCCSKSSGYWHTDAADNNAPPSLSAKKCACSQCKTKFPSASTGALVGLFAPDTDTDWSIYAQPYTPRRHALWLLAAHARPLSRQLATRHFASLPPFASERANHLQTYRC